MIEMPTPKFGWIADDLEKLASEKHFHLAKHSFKTGESDILTVTELGLVERTPIRDQGTELGSCVGCTYASAGEHLLGGKTLLSALGGYVMALELDGNPGQDVGTRLSTMGRVYQVFGVPEERYYPYDPSTFPYASGYDPKKAGMPTLARERAYDHRGIASYIIQMWGRSPVDVLTDIRDALKADRKVPLGHSVSRDFWTYDGSDPTVVFDAPSVSIGEHCSLIAGVRKLDLLSPLDWEFKLQEPWSTRWGLRGYAWVKASFITSIGNQASVLTMLPGEYEEVT